MIISIQSQVAYGKVGNSAAVPVMQGLGIDVVQVPTAILSNHPHYPTMRGALLEPAFVEDLLRGVAERGLTDTADAIVTGFLGSAETGEIVADFVAHALRQRPDLLYICDPVCGDEDIGAFQPFELVALFRERLLPLAQVTTPNLWEARAVTGREGAAALDLLAPLHDLGPQRVVVTGGLLSGEQIRTLASDGRHLWHVLTPRLDVRPAGTGDLFSGALAAHLVQGAGFIEATARATRLAYATLLATSPRRWAEMPLPASLSHHDAEEAVLVEQLNPVHE